MLEIAHPNYYNHDNDDDDATNDDRSTIILPYATKVVDDNDNTDTNGANTTTGTAAAATGATAGIKTMTWPVSPTADKVGDFKVSPSIHVGYAITWYGLSMAGLYMTRLLLFKR
jgi:cytochrome oxidase assembly protein ShyY1